YIWDSYLIAKQEFSLSALSKFRRSHKSDIFSIRTSDELTHCRAFFVRPYECKGRDLFRIFIPPSNHAIAFAASQFYSQTRYHKFHCIRTSHSPVTIAFLSQWHVLTLLIAKK
ncbi:MAG: hypothetical protein WA941_04310, partial [Nitrososphaeraceae archaeon]